MNSNDVTRRFLISATLTIAVSSWIAACSSDSEHPNTRTIQQRLTAELWQEGQTYQQGDRVSYNGGVYEALQEHTPQVGAGWNPEASPSLWSYLGIDDGQTAPGGTAGASGTGGLSGTPSATVGADAARVMGFESPESDWNTASPGVVSRETNVVHGTSSLGVTGATWSRLESVPIPWTGVPAVTTVGFDVFVPAPTNQPGWWGSVALTIQIPSLGITEWIGQQGLDETSLARFRRVEFQLSPTIALALASDQPDVRFLIDVSRPDVEEPYVLDRMTLSTLPEEPILGQAPSEVIDSVLSFESLSFWEVSSGTPSLGTDPTNREHTLALDGIGYVDLTTRVQLSSLSQVGEVATLDVKLPEDHPNPWWRGDVSLTLHLPSQGLHWHWVAGTSLQDLTPGVWEQVEIPLPPEIRAKLENDYSDLRIKLSVNGPPSVEAYELDNLSFGHPQAEIVRPDYKVSIPLPKGLRLQDVALGPAGAAEIPLSSVGRLSTGRQYVTGALALENTRVLRPQGGFATVVDRPAIFGPILHRSEVGDLWSSQGINSDHASIIHGDAFLRAPTSRFPEPLRPWPNESESHPATVVGQILLGQNQPWADVASWEVFAPPGGPRPRMMGQVLPPGDYGYLSVKAPTEAVILTTGEYSFQGMSMVTALLTLDNSAGPIIITNYGPLRFVRSNIFQVDPNTNNVAIFHMSKNTVQVRPRADRNWSTMLVAPFATVKIDGGEVFRGSVFAKNIYSHEVDIVHEPFVRDCTAAHENCTSLIGCERIDTDRDSLADCEEERDLSPWTDPEIFNGVAASNEFPGSLCIPMFLGNCNRVDELSEIEACIETGNGETIHQYAGWSSAEQAPDDLSDGSEWSVHAPHFNSLPEARGIYGGPFGSGYEWAVLSKAMIYLDQGGRHCFEVSGQVDGQMCRSLFLDEGATALGVADGVYCEDLEAGIYPISWFVVGGRTGDGDSPLGESYSFNYCFGGAEDCNPTGPIPLEMLRPEHDGNGVCLRDDDCDDGLSCCGSGLCGSDCPPDSGGPPAVCQDDVECLIGEVCSDIAPFALGLPDLFQSVCWNGGCASGTTNCGTPDALCGNCVCQPSCENKECGDSPFDGCNGFCTGFCDSGEPGCTWDTDCPANHQCLKGAGSLFGHAPDENVCVPHDCKRSEVHGAECGFEGARCGNVCARQYIPCQGMACGADPLTGEACGTCGAGLVCNLQNTCSVPVTSPPDDTEFSIVYGVGAMSGNYTTNLSGRATYSIPLFLPPGAGGVEPRLQLDFQDTSNLRGPLGPGWRLIGLSRIHRCPTPIYQDIIWGVRPQESLPSTFCLDGLPLLRNEQLTDNEANFGIVVYQPAHDPSRKIVFNEFTSVFTMYAADGRIHSFGTAENSQRRVRSGSEVNATVEVESWYLAETKDRFHNVVEYHYLADGPADAEHNHAIYPSQILYSRREGSVDFSRRVNFRYIEKDDPLGKSAGFLNHVPATDSRLLESITIDTFDGARQREAVRSYYVEYERIPGNGEDGLQRVAEIRECARAVGAETCLPATTFTYDDRSNPRRFAGERVLLDQGAAPPLNVRLDWKKEVGEYRKTARVIPLDADGDGLKDLFVIFSDDRDETYSFLRGQISEGGAFTFADPVTVSPVLVGPPLFPNLRFNFRCMSPASVADLDGDGREEIVDGCPDKRGRNYLAYFRLSAEGELTEHLTNKPVFADEVHVGDIDGNGRPDFIQEADTLLGLNQFVYFSNFRSYDEAGVMQLDLHRVSAVGRKARSAPLFVDVDGDGVANFLRFSPGHDQFYALGFVRDSEEPGAWTELIDGPGGTSFAVVNHAPRWSPTGLSYEWDPLDGGGHGNRDTARVLDINGDGLPDVWVQRNTFNAPYNPADFDTTVGPFTLVDTRGLIGALNTYNGLAGWGYHAGPSDIWLNVGGSFKRMKAILASVDGNEPLGDDCAQDKDGDCILVANQHIFRNSTVLDYDRDGREELVMVSSEIQARFHVVSETDGALHVAITSLPEFSGDAAKFAFEFWYGKDGLLSTVPTWSDFDGDGNVDMLTDWLGSTSRDVHDVYSQLVFYPGRGSGRGRRLDTVTDGLGNHLKIERALARDVVDMSGNCGRDDAGSGNQPRCLRRLGPLVQRVTRGNVDGDHFGSTSYSYEHPTTADFLQRYFFSGRTVRQESDQVVDGQPEVITTIHERYGDALKQWPYKRASVYPFLTAPTTVETVFPSAPDLNETMRGRRVHESRKYAFMTGHGIPYMHERVERTIDEVDSGEETVLTVAESFSVDLYGLRDGHSRVVYGGGSWPIISEYSVSMTRDADPDRWILDKVDRMTVSEKRGPTLASDESFRFERDDETGFVTSTTRLPTTQRELVTVYEPDSFGNVQLLTSGDRETRFDYGDSGIYLRQVQNAAGHVQSFGYDDALGKLTTFTNENNYRLVQGYDGFGREVLRRAENGAETVIHSQIQISAASPVDVDGQSIRSRLRLTATSDLYSGVSYREFDSRGHLVRTRVPGLGVNGTTPHLFAEQVYDWAGRRVRSSQEHVDSADPGWTTSSYDKRGRPTLVESPQGIIEYRHASQRQYEDSFPAWVMNDGVDLIHITDPEGLERVQVADHKGQAVLTADGVNLAGADTGLVSKVILGAWDLPTRLIDPELNETINRYTDDGLLESTEDLDRGRTEWTYDLFGNVHTELGADGVESVFSYDSIDRLISRIDKLTDGDQVSEWEYDLDVPGTLSSMTGATGIRTEFEYEHNSRALQTGARYIVGERTFLSETQYDSLGRTNRVVYPSIDVNDESFQFAIRPIYDAHSGRQLAVVSDDQSTEYWKIENIDYVNHDVSLRFGNGVFEERKYDPLTRRLDNIKTVGTSGEVMGELDYQHYANGRMLERKFTHDGDIHVRGFTYDRAGRLATVTDDGEGESFGFSASGRLLSRSKLGAYTYDALQPHAVTVIGENEFSYDARGNQEVRKGPEIEGGWQTTRKFSRFNLPEQVDVGDPDSPTEVLRYQYGADGQRVERIAELANVEVLTPGDFYERTTTTGVDGESVLHKFRVFAGGREVLQVQYHSETDAFSYAYLHRDHLNSVLFTTDEAGNRSQVRDFDAFGAAISTPEWVSSIDESFTGHKVDSALGLLEAGARMYDAKFGVFTSPDPLRISGRGSQAFNPFAYANNDPVNWYDPTGFTAVCDNYEGDAYCELFDDDPSGSRGDGNSGTSSGGTGSASAGGSGQGGDPPIGPPLPPTADESGTYIDGSLDSFRGALPTLADYYGSGSSSNANIDMLREVHTAGASYDTWNTIGVTLTTILEVGSLRGLVASALRRVGVGVAAKGAGLLARSEAAGGHLVARHVGQSAAALDARIAAQANVNVASSFRTLAEAEGAVASVLSRNTQAVSSWVNAGANGRLVVNGPFSGGLIRVVGGNSAQATGARFVLQGNGSGGYHVLTGFPVP